MNGVNDRAINVKITIRRRIPITIGHDVNCDDHATGARTIWGNRVIVRERQREKQREREGENGSSTRIPPSVARSSMSDLIARVREPMKGNGTRPLLQAFTVVAIAGRLTLRAVGERAWVEGVRGERYRVVEACSREICVVAIGCRDVISNKFRD